MAQLSFDLALRNARLQAIITILDVAATASVINFYTGVKPAITGATITTETLIAETFLSKPSGTVSNSVLTFAPISDDISTNNTGIIGWARILDGNGIFIMDATCGLQGSGAVFEFNTLNAQAGGIVRVLTGIITEGNA